MGILVILAPLSFLFATAIHPTSLSLSDPTQPNPHPRHIFRSVISLKIFTYVFYFSCLCTQWWIHKETRVVKWTLQPQNPPFERRILTPANAHHLFDKMPQRLILESCVQYVVHSYSFLSFLSDKIKRLCFNYIFCLFLKPG